MKGECEGRDDGVRKRDRRKANEKEKRNGAKLKRAGDRRMWRERGIGDEKGREKGVKTEKGVGRRGYRGIMKGA